MWPYIKMIAICWLVIPRFTGASYAYKCLVHPCLSLNLKVVINWFNTKSFLAELERYVKENGTEALEELIANKVKHVDGNLVWTKKKAVGVKEFSVPEGGEENPLQEKPDSMEVKKEWTCGTCKVTTHSEAILNIHLQGKKHRAKCEELKASKQATQTKNSSSSTSNESNHANSDPENVELKEWTCGVCEVTTQSETTFNSHLQGRKHKAKCEAIQDQTKCVFGDGQNLNETQNQEEKVGVIAKSEQCEQKRLIKDDAMIQQYWCSVCNIWCPGEIGMNSHLNGSMHMSRVQEWAYFSGVEGWGYCGSMIYQ